MSLLQMHNETLDTIGQQTWGDPDLRDRIEAAVAAVRKRAALIDRIRPPIEALEESYLETVEAFSSTRGGHLFFPYLGSGIGNGPFVELGDGSVKLDFINGIGAHPFGHSHPEIMKASLQAALGDTVMQGNLQQNVESLSFSRKLLAAANQDGHRFDHCFLSSSGVMAGENMLKIAFQARQPADRVLAFEGCFAGRTLAFSQITDKAAYRVGLPQTLNVDYVPFYDHNDPAGSTERAVSALRAHLMRYPKQHAAFIYELIQGEGGFYPGSRDFFEALMSTCRESGILNLCDEVQSFARTRSLFAFQTFELSHWIDGVWIGKASQVCATLFKSEHKPKPGLLSQTFTSSSTALATGECILDMLTEGDFLGADGRIEQTARYFHGKLAALSQKRPHWIKGPYGIGAMTAFTPFQGKAAQAKAVVDTLFRKGVMAFIAGANPCRVRFLWPIGATERDHIDLAVDTLEEALQEIAARA